MNQHLATFLANAAHYTPAQRPRQRYFSWKRGRPVRILILQTLQ
jgi:hypothetical protein